MLDILIVEDNKEIGGLLETFLRKENYVVSVADSGEKAINASGHGWICGLFQNP